MRGGEGRDDYINKRQLAQIWPPYVWLGTAREPTIGQAECMADAGMKEQCVATDG